MCGRGQASLPAGPDPLKKAGASRAPGGQGHAAGAGDRFPCEHCQLVTRWRPCSLGEAQQPGPHHIWGITTRPTACDQQFCIRPQCPVSPRACVLPTVLTTVLTRRAHQDPSARVHYFADPAHAVRVCKTHVSVIFFLGQLLAHIVTLLPFWHYRLATSLFVCADPIWGVGRLAATVAAAGMLTLPLCSVLPTARRAGRVWRRLVDGAALPAVALRPL